MAFIFSFLKSKLSPILAYIAAIAAFLALYKSNQSLKAKNKELEYELAEHKQQNELLSQKIKTDTDVNQLNDVAVLERLHSKYSIKK